MRQSFCYEFLPTIDQLFWDLSLFGKRPFSIEFRQGTEIDIIECETIRDLHDFLCDREYCDPDVPFTLDIADADENMSDEVDSLTVEQRNWTP